MGKLKTPLLALALGLAVINSGCTTTQTSTTAPDGTVTVTKVTRLDTQDAAEAAVIAQGVLANPLVSNLVYKAISP